MLRKLSLAALALGLSASASFAATEITFWHSMSGPLGDRVAKIADDFNKSQSDVVVKPVFRGEYEESMVGTIAAFRAHQQPTLVQVYEVGTGTMMAAKGAVYPVYKLMEETGQKFDTNGFLPAVAGYYTDTQGHMLSMPFNSSTPILYYNKEAFKKAGLDPETPPKTWEDIAAFSKKIVESGAAKCGFTMAYAATWVGLENFSAWHNQPIGTKENGFGGLDAKLAFNGPLQQRFWGDLKKWSDAGFFKYGGPAGAPDAGPLFYSSTCAIYMNSSGSRAAVMANAKGFDVGFGMMPYYSDVKGAPQNSIIGGASVWVLQGHSKDEYKAAAKFLAYLSSPEVQAAWHQGTGYLPITTAAYDLSKQQGYYEKNPGADVAIKQITLNTPTENSKGLRFGNFPQIRSILDNEFEQVLNGKKDPKAALDSAVERGNKILADFKAANE